MIKKISTCLFSPRKIILFVRERKLMTFLYVCLILLISLIPSLFSVFMMDSFSVQELNNLQYTLNTSSSNIDTFKIEDGILNTDEKYIIRYGSLESLAFNHEPTLYNSQDSYVISFDTTNVKLYFANIVLVEKSYDEIGLSNFNFADFINNNISSREQFYYAYRGIIDSQIGFIRSTTIVQLIFNIVVSYLLLAFICALLIRSPYINIPLGIKFNVSLYAGTIYLLLTLLGSLYGISLSLIGIILMFVYSQKAISTIVKIETR